MDGSITSLMLRHKSETKLVFIEATTFIIEKNLLLLIERCGIEWTNKRTERAIGCMRIDQIEIKSAQWIAVLHSTDSKMPSTVHN